LFLAKKIFFKVGQRKFKLDWEQIGDIYIWRIFFPKIHDGCIIMYMYIHTEIFENKLQVFCVWTFV
jgi:hypothetical protein